MIDKNFEEVWMNATRDIEKTLREPSFRSICHDCVIESVGNRITVTLCAGCARVYRMLLERD